MLKRLVKGNANIRKVTGGADFHAKPTYEPI